MTIQQILYDLFLSLLIKGRWQCELSLNKADLKTKKSTIPTLKGHCEEWSGQVCTWEVSKKSAATNSLLMITYANVGILELSVLPLAFSQQNS